MNIKHHLINNILLINLANVGDVVLSTPIARALGSFYKHAKIDLLVTPQTAAVAKLFPNVNDVIVYDKLGKDKDLLNFLKLIIKLRKKKYQLALSANLSERSVLIAFLSGSLYRIGFKARGSQWFLTHTVDSQIRVGQHNTEYLLTLLDPLGIKNSDSAPFLNVSTICSIPKDRSKKFEIVLCPCGRSKGKSWSIEGFAEIIKQFSSLGQCYLIGGTAEQSILKEINKKAKDQATVLAGTYSLTEIAQLISRADLMISVDTGPAHIAEAVNTPAIVLFGPTDSNLWGPRKKHSVIISCKLDCGPCHDDAFCQNQYRCMKGITVEEVIAHAKRILEI